MEYLIREETPADIDAIRHVHDLAFAGKGEGKLVDELRIIDQERVSVVAERGKSILGHVLLSRITAPMRALALGPVAVHPDEQCRGIGSALIRSGLARAKTAGWEAIFVLGSPKYYGRFGFEVEAAEGFTSKYSGAHFMALLLRYGAPRRGQLVYPAPWAALD